MQLWSSIRETEEYLAVCKARLESRTMVRLEMFPIINKMLNACGEGENNPDDTFPTTYRVDRLEEVKALEEKDGAYAVAAEVFGDRMDMWVRSQGELVEIIKGS